MCVCRHPVEVLKNYLLRAVKFQIYPCRWNSISRNLLRPRSNLGGHQLVCRRSKQRDRVYVLIIRLGMFVLAALGAAIREAAGISAFNSGNNGE